jgi:hypothetical protein
MGPKDFGRLTAVFGGQKPPRRSSPPRRASQPPQSPRRSSPPPHSPLRRAALGSAAGVVLRMSLRPGSEDALPYVHDFITRYTTGRFRSAVAASVSLAAFELVSNGFTYCSAVADVVLEVIEQDGEVLVQVTNASIPARIARLRDTVEKITRDPRLTYNEQLERSLANPSRALLGLARVAHEGAMRLEMAELEANVVQVTAGRGR